MKISVVMATFNSEATVRRAIDSFLAQTYSNVELIVADGNSSDRTCEIVISFGDDRIQLRSEKDSGIYDGINKGIRRASGEVIGLLHSNDLFASNRVIETIAGAFKVPELDAAYADVVMFPQNQPTKVIRHYRSGRFRPDRLKFGIMPAHPTLYLRRQVFEKFGYYDPTYRISGDFEFVGRIFKDGHLESRYFDEVWMKMQTGGASTGGIKSKYILNKEVIRACRSLDIRTNWGYMMTRYQMKIGEFFGRTPRY
jgi:glycosyltransferase involved in cell wall biosynthesis